MKIIKLQPIRYPITLSEELEREIVKAVTKEIYYNVFKLLNFKKSIIKKVKNSMLSDFGHSLGYRTDLEELAEALRFGNLTYKNGMFSGPLDAGMTRALRKAGAYWDPHWSVFRLPEDELDPDLKQMISAAQDGYKNQMKTVQKYLDKIDPEEVSGKVAVNRLFDNAIKRTEKSFQQNVKNITLAPELTDQQRAAVVDRWKENAQESIQGLVTDQVSRLRARVAQSVQVGTRYANLVKGIQAEHKGSVGRAKLIARQETKALVNSYAEERYSDAGVQEYAWHCVNGTAAHPTRARHRALADASKKGTLYRFDDPPVVTEPGEPERRANPGFDFRCRCWAQPIIKFGGS